MYSKGVIFRNLKNITLFFPFLIYSRVFFLIIIVIHLTMTIIQVQDKSVASFRLWEEMQNYIETSLPTIWRIKGFISNRPNVLTVLDRSGSTNKNGTSSWQSLNKWPGSCRDSFVTYVLGQTCTTESLTLKIQVCFKPTVFGSFGPGDKLVHRALFLFKKPCGDLGKQWWFLQGSFHWLKIKLRRMHHLPKIITDWQGYPSRSNLSWM